MLVTVGVVQYACPVDPCPRAPWTVSGARVVFVDRVLARVVFCDRCSDGLYAVHSYLVGLRTVVRRRLPSHIRLGKSTCVVIGSGNASAAARAGPGGKGGEGNRLRYPSYKWVRDSRILRTLRARRPRGHFYDGPPRAWGGRRGRWCGARIMTPMSKP